MGAGRSLLCCRVRPSFKAEHSLARGQGKGKNITCEQVRSFAGREGKAGCLQIPVGCADGFVQTGSHEGLIYYLLHVKDWEWGREPVGWPRCEFSVFGEVASVASAVPRAHKAPKEVGRAQLAVALPLAPH